MASFQNTNGFIVTTVEGSSGAELAADDATHGLIGKRAVISQFTVGAQEVDVLLRIQETNGGMFIDLVVAATVAALDTAVGSMSLATANHPAPAEDAADTAILVAAAA